MFSIFSLPEFTLPRTLEAVDIGARIEGTPRWSPLAAHDAVRVTAFEPQAEDRRKLEASAWPVRCLAEHDRRAQSTLVQAYVAQMRLLESVPSSFVSLATEA